MLNTQCRFAQIFLTNPSKLTIYLCKIPTVVTDTLIVCTNLKRLLQACYNVCVFTRVNEQQSACNFFQFVSTEVTAIYNSVRW